MELGFSAWKREKQGRQRGFEKVTGGLALRTDHELCSPHSSWLTRYIQQDAQSIPHIHGQLCCEVPVVSMLVIPSYLLWDSTSAMFSLSLLHIWGLLWSTKGFAAQKGFLTVQWIALYHTKTALWKGRKDLSDLWDDQLTQELKEYGQDVELAQAATLGGSKRALRKWGINVHYFWNFLLCHCLPFQIQLVMSVQRSSNEFSKPMARSSPTQKWHALMASQRELPSLPLMPPEDWK